jgi:uncharacterized protein YjdB
MNSKSNKTSLLPGIIIIVLILGVIGYLIISNTDNTYINNNTNNEENNNTNNNSNNSNSNDNNQNNNSSNNNNNQNTNIELKSISLSPSSKEIKVGDSFTLTINYNPTNTTNKKVTLKTSNKNVATIDKNGTVVGIKEGTATITVTSSNGKTSTCTVKVVANQSNEKYEIKYNKKTVTKIVGERPFKNTLTNTGKNTNITYSSSNKKVAIVDKDGTVKLVGVGKTTITATINDKNYKTKKASYEVVANFNHIAYSSIKDSGKKINSLEHIKYVVQNKKFNSLKVDLQPTEDGYLVLCHDAGFTLNCDIKKNKDLSGCKIINYDKNNKNTMPINKLAKSQIKKLKYANGNTVAFLDDYVKIMNQHKDKLLYITVRSNILDKYPNKKYNTYLDYFLASLDSDTKKRTIINCTASNVIPKIRDRDKKIMVAHVVSDASGNISSSHVDYAIKYNCILVLFVFRGKTQQQALNTFKGNEWNKKLVDKALNKGVPVYTAIVSEKKFVTGNNLGQYGLSGAHIITSLD